MIVNPVPWIQSCALWTYRTSWYRVRFLITDGTYTYTQSYFIFYYETLPDGIKLSWNCVPTSCIAIDSSKCWISRIDALKPDGTVIVIYSGLGIRGWSGILWSVIFINEIVTA
jgi:hypothetical protein